MTSFKFQYVRITHLFDGKVHTVAELSHVEFTERGDQYV